MMVADGRLRTLTDDEAAALGSRAVDPASLSVLSGMGPDALAPIVDPRSDGGPPEADAVVLTCSCGHVILAR